jgi:hypothetical protein
MTCPLQMRRWLWHLCLQRSLHSGYPTVIDIAGIDAGDLGCQCREHRVCYGKVVRVDMVVQSTSRVGVDKADQTFAPDACF